MEKNMTTLENKVLTTISPLTVMMEENRLATISTDELMAEMSRRKNQIIPESVEKINAELSKLALFGFKVEDENDRDIKLEKLEVRYFDGEIDMIEFIVKED